MKLSIQKHHIRTQKEPINENTIYFYGTDKLPCFIYQDFLVYIKDKCIDDVFFVSYHKPYLNAETEPLTKDNLQKYFNIKTRDEYEPKSPRRFA